MTHRPGNKLAETATSDVDHVQLCHLVPAAPSGDDRACEKAGKDHFGSHTASAKCSGSPA